MKLEPNFESLGRVFSREQMRDFSLRVKSAGLAAEPESFAGFLVAITLVSIMFLALVLIVLPAGRAPFATAIGALNLPGAVAGLLTFISILVVSAIVVLFIAYTVVNAYLILTSEARKNAVEAILPDFLTLISANVRAGMTLDQAIWYSAKPEFGILSIEVRDTIKGAFSGESLSTALDKLNERFDSRVLNRTFALLKQASYTGGEVAKVLEMTADDARETAMLKKDISASMLIYEIFVLFSGTIGAPFLFGVVNMLLSTLEKSMQYLPQTTSDMYSFIRPSTPTVTSGDFYIFSIATIFITIAVSSLIVGVVQTGSRNQGFKYFPFMLVAAYIVFFLVISFLQSFFASMPGT
jgi:pilus assembly protein TadC